MNRSKLPPREELLRRLHYDPATGALTWKERPDRAPWWNAKYAGKEAGYLTPEGSRTVNFDYRLYKASRLIWMMVYGEEPGPIVDHKNGNPSDNRISNLRLSTPSQNGSNRKRNQNKELPKGVVKVGRKYRVMISGSYIGRFATVEEAEAAYLGAARVIYGKFARKS